nr:putative late blight resistance protein homolog R1A-4 [Ipomoea batatas]
MAYAAVTSLTGTLSQHFLQPQPRLPLQYKKQILSLHQNLGFLQEVLEKSEIAYAYDNSAMKDLEAQIRDVAFKAEERIEMELTTIYQAKGWTKRIACLLRLHGIFIQAVIQTDYLKKKLIKIKSEKQLAKGPSQEVFKHWNMQSFIVRGAHATLDSFEAYGIWKMPLLSNFYIHGIVSLGASSVVHRNLESISWLDSKLCTKDLFTRIPNLKKIGIYGAYDENNLDCFYNFVHLGQLEELSIREWYNPNLIPCSGISWATSFLPNLKKLKFFRTNLAWRDMRLIGMLPNLEVLKLKDAIDRKDRIWESTNEAFRQLKRLVIVDTFLERWIVMGDHFPLLECLELRECNNLQEIPSGFADITTLALIQLNWCWDSVLTSAKLIQEEQYNNYGNTLLVRSENIRYCATALIISFPHTHTQTQMAYAAVTSLMGTLSLHFLQPQPRLPLQYKQQILSLHQNLGFLQQILEKSETAYDDVEAEIRDAAFEAEERIEMQLTTIYVAKGWTKSLACLRLHGIFIQAVIQTDYLKKKYIKISEKQLAKVPSQGERMPQRGLATSWFNIITA